MKIHHFTGNLVIPEKTTSFDIGVFDNRFGEQIRYDSISQTLDSIYMNSPTSLVHVILRIWNDKIKGWEDIFDEKGILFYDKAGSQFYTFHIWDIVREKQEKQKNSQK